MTASGNEPAPERSLLALAGGSILALAWFGFVFFFALPAAILWGTGSGLSPPPGMSRWVAGFTLVAASALLVPPVAAFVAKGRGTQAPIAPPRRFVDSGFYSRVRNPMYTLYVVIVLGEAILYRSPALFAYSVAFFAMEHWYVVRVEERELRRRFGAEYEAYCERVGRWLPRRRRAT